MQLVLLLCEGVNEAEALRPLQRPPSHPIRHVRFARQGPKAAGSLIRAPSGQILLERTSEISALFRLQARLLGSALRRVPARLRSTAEQQSAREWNRRCLRSLRSTRTGCALRCGRRCSLRLTQQRVALLADRSRVLPSARRLLARIQSQVAGHLLRLAVSFTLLSAFATIHPIPKRLLHASHKKSQKEITAECDPNSRRSTAKPAPHARAHTRSKE
jgi:hypothetical protein